MLPCSTVTSTVCSPWVSPSTTKASVLLLFADSVTRVSLPSTLTTISHASSCHTFSANLLPVKLYLIVPLPLTTVPKLLTVATSAKLVLPSV